MAHPRLQISDTLGDRDVTIEHFPFSIGRRETNDLKLPGSEVSREHAEIVPGQQISIHDRDSRYGTYVNGEKVTAECVLRSGDKIRLGRGGGADLVFLSADAAAQTSTRSTTAARDDCGRLRRCSKGSGPGLRPRAAGSAGAGPRRGDRPVGRRARVHHAIGGRQRA
jgi:hypothetical protein